MNGFQNRVTQQASFDDVLGAVSHNDDIRIPVMGIGQQIGFGIAVNQIGFHIKSMGLAVIRGFF